MLHRSWIVFTSGRLRPLVKTTCSRFRLALFLNATTRRIQRPSSRNWDWILMTFGHTHRYQTRQWRKSCLSDWWQGRLMTTCSRIISFSINILHIDLIFRLRSRACGCSQTLQLLPLLDLSAAFDAADHSIY
jgi:hypothetical protein